MLREAIEEAKLNQTIEGFKDRFEVLTKSSDEKKYGTGKKTAMVAVQGKHGTYYRQQQVGRNIRKEGEQQTIEKKKEIANKVVDGILNKKDWNDGEKRAQLDYAAQAIEANLNSKLTREEDKVGLKEMHAIYKAAYQAMRNADKGDKQRFTIGTLAQYSAGRKNAQALHNQLKNGYHASKADYDAAIKDLTTELGYRTNLAEISQIETLISNLKEQSPKK